MSTRAPGETVNPPDMPVKAFSPDLESSYECLHRCVCASLLVPDSIVDVASRCNKMLNYYYDIRRLLEEDWGISKTVADALPLPEEGDFLKMVYAWEDSLELAQVEYTKRDIKLSGAPANSNFEEPFDNPVNCWHTYRWRVFEASRILRITRQRIADDVPETKLKRYPWITASHLRFE